MPSSGPGPGAARRAGPGAAAAAGSAAPLRAARLHSCTAHWPGWRGAAARPAALEFKDVLLRCGGSGRTAPRHRRSLAAFMCSNLRCTRFCYTHHRTPDHTGPLLAPPLPHSPLHPATPLSGGGYASYCASWLAVLAVLAVCGCTPLAESCPVCRAGPGWRGCRAAVVAESCSGRQVQHGDALR